MRPWFIFSLTLLASFAMVPANQAHAAPPDHTLGVALMSAQISSAGSLVRGSGTVSSSKLSTGQYEIIFNRDVTTCTYSVTMSTSQGETLAQPRSLQPNGVFVATYTSAGAGADRGFHLLVFCHQ